MMSLIFLLFDQIYLFYTFTSGATLKTLTWSGVCLVNFALVACGTTRERLLRATECGPVRRARLRAGASSICTIAEEIPKVCHKHCVFAHVQILFQLGYLWLLSIARKPQKMWLPTVGISNRGVQVSVVKLLMYLLL